MHSCRPTIATCHRQCSPTHRSRPLVSPKTKPAQKVSDIAVKVQDYSDVAFGWAMEDTTGFAKVIVDQDTGLILGAHIMGHQASSLIQPLIQAMNFDLPATDMARGQYWIHPALPEVIENALLALCGEPPWPPSKRH